VTLADALALLAAKSGKSGGKVARTSPKAAAKAPATAAAKAVPKVAAKATPKVVAKKPAPAPTKLVRRKRAA